MKANHDYDAVALRKKEREEKRILNLKDARKSTKRKTKEEKERKWDEARKHSHSILIAVFLEEPSIVENATKHSLPTKNETSMKRNTMILKTLFAVNAIKGSRKWTIKMFMKLNVERALRINHAMILPMMMKTMKTDLQ